MLFLAVGVREAIAEDAVDEFLVTEFGAGAEVGEVVGGVGHGFGAAGDDHVGVAGHDGLGTEDDGFDAGGADFVYGGADCAVVEAGAECALAGWVLANAEDGVSYAGAVCGSTAYFADKTLPKKTSWTSEGLSSGTLWRAAVVD